MQKNEKIKTLPKNKSHPSESLPKDPLKSVRKYHFSVSNCWVPQWGRLKKSKISGKFFKNDDLGI
jgi:hypothetical protein